ncbi:nucleotide exchange factor GrpE [Candidatus Synechococcus calcipolaris G9]|uniref:Protein GrpE n=1 Tax=Candidatus Synechococcus calcipolaris G9 TaxID=1497997 RepID=A0ABT6F186_9SYNE|nr:nucleotide exchange factor GrpE [Candidatus Synechococcus calcipolaris]MDG2991543.1 nucleotide exchange factor GrpE [Candidatus Synechococcus calcipolaris G9]
MSEEVTATHPNLETQDNDQDKDLAVEQSHGDGQPQDSAQPIENSDLPEDQFPEEPPEVSNVANAETDSSPEADPGLQEHLTVLEREQENLKQQVEERTGQYVRLAADFENYRKRTQREKDDLELQIKCATISELLPVVDSFELARTHIQTQTEAEEKIHRSYQGVYKQLVDCLKRVGVSPMRPEGKPFDPNLHEAVLRQPTADQPEGTVLEELKRGYLLGERVLRHAMVKVAAPPEDDEADATPTPSHDSSEV